MTDDSVVVTAYGRYRIEVMPNQPAVALCCGFVVFDEHRGMGYGHALKAHQMATLARRGFAVALCTVRSGNAPQRAILREAGWLRVARPFHSRATAVLTELWFCPVFPEMQR